VPAAAPASRLAFSPAAGREQGQVEKSVQDSRHLVLQPMPDFPDLATLNARLFHLPRKLDERSGVVTTTNLGFSEGATVFGAAQMTTARLDRPTHRCHILKTGNDSFRFTASSAAPRRQTEGRPAPTRTSDDNHNLQPGHLSLESPARCSAEIDNRRFLLSFRQSSDEGRPHDDNGSMNWTYAWRARSGPSKHRGRLSDRLPAAAAIPLHSAVASRAAGVSPLPAGTAQTVERVRNRCSRPLSRLNMPPRPGTTSMTRSVCRQTANWLLEM